jgi:hypothetical protein
MEADLLFYAGFQPNPKIPAMTFFYLYGDMKKRLNDKLEQGYIKRSQTPGRKYIQMS